MGRARCLHDLIDLKDDRLFLYIPNSELSFVVPSEIEMEDFMKYRTSLGVAMEAIKRKNTGPGKDGG